MDDAGEKHRHRNVKNGADAEGAQDPHWHVALRVASFLRGRGDGVKPDVGEKDDRGASGDSGEAELPEAPRVGRHEGTPVDRGHLRMAKKIGGGHGDKDDDRAHLDEHDGQIETGRLLDAHDQDSRYRENREAGRQVEGRGDARKARRVDAGGAEAWAERDQRLPAILE